MRFILETKLNNLKGKKLKIKKIGFVSFEEWCLENKKECLDQICGGDNWYETEQGIVAGGYIELDNYKLKQIPFKFYEVYDGFYVNDNLLTSLNNSPEFVGWDFLGHNNKLQNLIGGPRRVNWDYVVSGNQINSLKGAPEYVGRIFWIKDQKPPGKQWTVEEVTAKTKVERYVEV